MACLNAKLLPIPGSPSSTRQGWSDVDLAHGTLSYVQRKTGKQVTVPLHPELQAGLEKIATSDKPQLFVIPGMADKGPGGRHGLSESFKALVRKAGLFRNSACESWPGMGLFQHGHRP